MQPEDWPAVQAIYEQGIATRQATFETEAPGWDAWDAGHLDEPRLVAEEDGEVVGWAALSPVSRRPCYAGVAEGSVYVAEHARGRGLGRALLEQLCADADAAGIWTIQTSIFPENSRQPRAARALRLPRRRNARADRAARRRLARHRAAGEEGH